MFTAPFMLDMKQLHSVRFPLDEELQKTDEPFRIFTHSGDVLNGRSWIIILRVRRRCERHGRMALKRSRIRSFRRLNDPALIFEDRPAWQNGRPSVAHEMSTIGAPHLKVVCKPRLLELSCIEISSYLPSPKSRCRSAGNRNRASSSLSSSRTHGGVPKHTVSSKLETWDDELVMQAGQHGRFRTGRNPVH